MGIRELGLNVFLFSCIILVIALFGIVMFLIQKQINWGIYKPKVNTEIRVIMKQHVEQYHKEKK